jgi:hypothetical protein
VHVRVKHLFHINEQKKRLSFGKVILVEQRDVSGLKSPVTFRRLWLVRIIL